MTNPTLSYGDGFLDDLIDWWDWDYESEATSDGAVGKTTTVDSVRTEADDTWNGYYIKYLTGNNAGEHRLITDFDQGTTTFTHEAFSNQTLDGDEYILSKYVETLTNMAAGDAEPTPDDPEDVLAIEGTSDGGGAHDETAEYKHALATQLDSNVYTKVMIRYKVSSANVNAKAKLTFTAGTQDITLGNSTTWEVITTTITSGKTVTHASLIWLHELADADGTYTVYFDFIKICKGVFTFPHVGADGKSGGVYPRWRSNDTIIAIPGRHGDDVQPIGMACLEIHLRGDVLQGESWGTPVGQYIHDIWYNDDWSWFTCDRWNGKVRIVWFEPAQDVGSGATCLWDLMLRSYSYSDLADDVWAGVDGYLGIEP